MSDRAIGLVAMDVDGVLTDGGIVFDGGDTEIKRFDVQDGFGIKLLQRAGIGTAIITGRTSAVVARRAADLGIDHVVQGSVDKLADLRKVAGAAGVPLDRVVYIGDDWPDLAVMRAVGLAVAPANAVAEVKSAAAMVTAARGGRGAVREAVNHILRLCGRYDPLLRQYDPSVADDTTRPTY